MNFMAWMLLVDVAVLLAGLAAPTGANLDGRIQADRRSSEPGSVFVTRAPDEALPAGLKEDSSDRLRINLFATGRSAPPLVEDADWPRTAAMGRAPFSGHTWQAICARLRI